MSERKSQRNEILACLLTGERITPLDALKRFKTLRLSGRIYDLKADGYDVKSERFKTKSGKWVARYFIPREAS